MDLFQRPFLGAPLVLALDAAPRRPGRTRDGRLIGRAVRPSAGVRAAYDARLRRLLDEMHVSVVYWLGAAYRRDEDRITALADDAYIRSASREAWRVGTDDGTPGGGAALRHLGMPNGGACTVEPALPPHQAFDARPSTNLDEVVRRLRRRWLRRFDDASEELARYFAKAVWQRSDAELKKILKRAGISVEFKISRAARDALGAIVHENVALIRSIPQQYLSQVEASVMRSVLAGRDLASLAADLQQHHGVARRRAATIALHQNNMASGAIQRIQYLDMGIERAIWMHSHAGKVPRWQHVEMDGKEYDVRQGMWDKVEQRYIRTGELIGCRCTNRPILPR